MEHEFLLVRRDRLLAGSSLVPVDQRASFFATLFVGIEAVSPEAVSPDAVDTDIASVTGDDTESPTSFPLSVEHARELRNKVEEATWAVIKAIVANAKDDVGTIEWSEVKRLTGVTNWAQFAKGRMGGLHRSLLKITGAAKGTVLLWEGDGWVEDGKGDYSAGTIGIDGPAVRTLRAVCGIHD